MIEPKNVIKIKLFLANLKNDFKLFFHTFHD